MLKSHETVPLNGIAIPEELPPDSDSDGGFLRSGVVTLLCLNVCRVV